MNARQPDEPMDYDAVVAELQGLRGGSDELTRLSRALERISRELDATDGPPDRDALWAEVERRMLVSEAQSPPSEDGSENASGR